MSMFFMSEKLLQNELNNKPDNMTDQQEFYYSMIEKELYVINRLNVEMCDLRGNEEEVADRLNRSVVIILPPEELDNMRTAVLFKDDIMDVIRKWSNKE